MYKNLQQIFNKVDEDTKVSQYRFVPAVFYCEWLPESIPEEVEIKEIVKSCYPNCCFNHFFGLPRKTVEDPTTGQSWESEPIELHPYEKRWIDNMQKHKFYALVKCRGAGGTEILIVRWFLYQAITNRIPDRKWLIVAGTSQKLAIEFLHRMKKLSDRHPFVYSKIPASARPNVLRVGISSVIALASDEESVTGYENVGGIALDESAKWNLIDDTPVLDAVEPHVAKSGAHVIVLSTPKHRRGFFWTKIFNPEIVTKYYRDKTTYEEVCAVDKPLLVLEDVLKMKETDPEMFAQEFNGEFVVPSDSLFGKLEEKNISHAFKPIVL